MIPFYHWEMMYGNICLLLHKTVNFHICNPVNAELSQQDRTWRPILMSQDSGREKG